MVWSDINYPHPTVLEPTFRSDCWNPHQTELNYLWRVLSFSQDDIRWFYVFSDVLSCFPMFSNCFLTVFGRCFPNIEILFKLDKLAMMNPQLFSGRYQMILDVFRCSQLFTDVFSWVVTFMDKPGCPPHLPRNIASICGKIGIHARFATFVLTPCCSTYTSITVAAKKLATRFATCVLTPFIAQQKPHKT